MPTGLRNAFQVDFRQGHVQDDIFAEGNGYISSESIVLAIKARHIDPVGGSYPELGVDNAAQTDDLAKFVAVGLVENVTIAQQKNIQQLFEIGSHDSYLIPGRTIIQAAFNRVIFDGDSLLRALYPSSTSNNVVEGTDGAHMPAYTDFSDNVPNAPGDSSGEGDLWFNLASSFFNKPFTAALLFYNDSAQLRGYVILERCYVEAHNLTVVAAQTVVSENVRIRASKVSAINGMGQSEQEA